MIFFNVIIQIRTILFCVFAGRYVTRKEANMFLYENPTMLELTRSIVDTQNARLTHSDDKEHILFIESEDKEERMKWLSFSGILR